MRYDAEDVYEKHPVFLKWKEDGRLVKICPEEDIKDAQASPEELEK